MSGIVGIVHFDGEPVDRQLLARMTNFLAFRGPDAQEIWLNRNVGFGHSLLKTTDEAEHERQPLTLDGRVWIVADARVDARRDLIPMLRAEGHEELATNAPDVELILRAYLVWGEDCVEHLLGDFTFAIWDAPRQRLFCARDHMGVRPFFYAHIGQKLIFSNTLDCIRQDSAVSSNLNDLAIGNFLLFGSGRDPATTTFAEIQRLPPAHFATWSRTGMRLRSYWALPVDDPISFPRPEDYIDRFRELLRLAVFDRLRTDRIGIFMSGGIDSPTLAVTACDVLREGSVEAFTAVYDRLIPDQERYYAELVATRCGIPIHYWTRDEELLTPMTQQLPILTAEPDDDPFTTALEFEYQKRVASHCRVFLCGEGPDNALICDWRVYLGYLAEKRCWRQLLRGFCFHLVNHHRVPLLGRIGKWRHSARWKPYFPGWLNEDFCIRLQLRDVWESHQSETAFAHPTRPRGYGSMRSELWQIYLDCWDRRSSQACTDVAHPYLDLRLLRYLLAVPAVPWCCNKHLLRRTMRGALPQAVLQRPKTPLLTDASFERARHSGMPTFPANNSVLKYIDPLRIPLTVGESVEEFRASIRSISLAYWLHHLEFRKQYILVQEEVHGISKNPAYLGRPS